MQMFGGGKKKQIVRRGEGGHKNVKKKIRIGARPDGNEENRQASFPKDI